MHLFEGSDYKATGRIELGSDADNIRVDAATNRVFIGYGSGALAVIDPSTRKKVGDISLKAHPESFQINPDTSQIFVNLPDDRGIAVVDHGSQKQIGKWSMANRGANFPMALDPARHHVLVIFRSPAELGVFSMTNGKLITTTDACSDADDLFIDAKHARRQLQGRLPDVLELKTRRTAHRAHPGFGARTRWPRWIGCLSPSGRVPEARGHLDIRPMP